MMKWLRKLMKKAVLLVIRLIKNDPHNGYEVIVFEAVYKSRNEFAGVAK